MFKSFIVALSVALFMLVCLVSADDFHDGGKSRGSPYGDYEHEQCLRVCYRQRPRCAYGWFTRLVGSCYTCCKIKQKYIPYEDSNTMEMEQDHQMEMNSEKPIADANMN